MASVAYLEYNKFKTSRTEAEASVLTMCNESDKIIISDFEHIMVSSPLRENEPPIYAPIMAVKCIVK